MNRFVMNLGIVLLLAGCPESDAESDFAVVDLASEDAGAQDLGSQDEGATDVGVTDNAVVDAPGIDAPAADSTVADSAADAAVCPDAIMPTLAPEIVMAGFPKGFATIAPGTAVNFSGVVNCPACPACTFEWDFGNGNKSTAKSPGNVTFSTQGLYRVTFTVRSTSGVELGAAEEIVTVWNGTRTDAFNRAQLQWDQYWWIKPLLAGAVYSISNNWLHVQHNLQLPGSTAIVMSPLVKDVHVEVDVKRAQLKTDHHYIDIILRMDPSNRAGSFYRVRIMEASETGLNALEIAIFKVSSASDQHGIVINDPDHPEQTNPSAWPSNCPTLWDFDPNRTQDMRVIVDLTDDTSGLPTFVVSIVKPSDPTQVLLKENGAKDEAANPHLNAGFTGLAHFDGDSYFDNWLLQKL